MPNIREFDAGALKLNPTETGVEAAAGTARRVGSFYSQQASAEDTLARETERLGGQTQQLGRETEQLGSEVGSGMSDVGRRIGSSIGDAGAAAIQYLDAKQISQGSATWATLLQNTTQQWNDTVKNANPNDPTVASKFMASLNDQLEDFQSKGFYTEGGQKFAEAHVEALRQHMAEKTMADMSTMAGQAAVVNQQQTINSLSATVHGDPTSLDFSLAALKSSTEGILSASPNLTGVQAGAARSEILQKGAHDIIASAAIGYITKTATVPPWATDPKYAPYINGAELKTWENAAKTQAKANAYYDKQTAATEKQMADLKVHAGATKVINDNVKIGPLDKPIISPNFMRDVLDIARNNPDAPSAAATVRTMMDWGESQQNKEAKIVDDPATKQMLTDKLFDPDHPTTRIDLMKAQVAGKLSNNSFQSMERLVSDLEQSPLKGPIWSATAAGVKERLIRTDLRTGDKIGADNYSSFIGDFVPKYLAATREGKLPANALDLNNPSSMISQSLAPYQQSMQDRLRASTRQPATAPAAEKPDAGLPPAPLRGIADLDYSPKRQQYRDRATGKIYGRDGSEVKQ